jgi:hypothetical protein
MEWHKGPDGADTGYHESGAFFRIVEDAPSAFRALVRVRAPAPLFYRWIGPHMTSSHDEAVAWCGIQVA